MINPTTKGMKMKKVSHCETVNEVLETIGAGQDYVVRGIPQFPTYRGIFDGNDNPVAIVNKSYAKNSFMQPREVFNYVDDLREGLGMTFDKAGFTKGGRRMFVSLRKTNAIVVDPKVGDTMDEVLYLWSSFDGSVQHVINKMIERLVCSNGMVTMDTQASTKIKHSRIAGDKLQSFVSDNIDNIKATYSDTKDIVYSLAETPVSHSDAKEVINRIFKGDSKRGENIRDEVFNRFTKGMGNRGETAWDLLNGITEYQNHGKSFRSTDGSSSSENRLTSLTLGTDANLMNRVWNELVSLN
jgi:hypothetical protein